MEVLPGKSRNDLPELSLCAYTAIMLDEHKNHSDATGSQQPQASEYDQPLPMDLPPPLPEEEPVETHPDRIESLLSNAGDLRERLIRRAEFEMRIEWDEICDGVADTIARAVKQAVTKAGYDPADHSELIADRSEEWANIVLERH